MTQEVQEHLTDDQELFLLHLSSAELRLTVTNYGARVVKLEVPDREERFANVVAGFPQLESYLQPNPYFGATIGRYANRIRGGRFLLDGRVSSLPCNDGPNSLHGGRKGFDQKVWDIHQQDQQSASLFYTSANGEEGYPGTLTVRVRFSVERDELGIAYEAATDEPTILNLTHHSYFNLSGFARGIRGHRLTLNAERYLPADETRIPTGELRPVVGTGFDFRKPRQIGRDEFDHTWVLSGSPAARLEDPRSGRVLAIETTEPGIHVYTGNLLDGSLVGHAGVAYGRNAALCLETQHYPDSPNRPEFPSTVLRPGEIFRSTTIYRFLRS